MDVVDVWCLVLDRSWLSLDCTLLVVVSLCLVSGWFWAWWFVDVNCFWPTCLLGVCLMVCCLVYGLGLLLSAVLRCWVLFTNLFVGLWLC